MKSFRQFNVEDLGQEHLSIAFSGHVGVGKTPLIRAIFEVAPNDKESGTDDIYGLDLGDKVFILDMPGLGDIRENRSAITETSLKKIDIFVLVLDFNVDPKSAKHLESSLKILKMCNEVGKPILICLNKIDIVRKSEIETRFNRWIEVLNVPEDTCITTAGYPLKGNAQGLGDLTRWIYDKIDNEKEKIRFKKKISSIRPLAESKIVNSAARLTFGGDLKSSLSALKLIFLLKKEPSRNQIIDAAVRLIRELHKLYDVELANDVLQHFFRHENARESKFDFQIIFPTIRQIALLALETALARTDLVPNSPASRLTKLGHQTIDFINKDISNDEFQKTIEHYLSLKKNAET